MHGTYQRRRTKHTERENNGFWLTFSDLMSALLLVFILVMFYSVYGNFVTNDELEIQTARLARQSELFDLKEAELDEKDAALQASQQKLTESEYELINKQLQLQLARESQEKIQQTLEERQKDLDDALSLLSMQQEDLASARALLDAQQARLDDQQVRLDALVGVRAKIVQSLAEALINANVKAKVDETTGSIALEASVLFDLGKSELKESGKVVLDQFLPVYLGVLMQPENEPNISEIIIEGHTDSMGTYMNNLKLSQQRALAVMEYILSGENTRISAEMKRKLQEIGTANGRSYANLKRDAQGNEDAEASRRVEFKFRMQDEQMIQSMREILGSMD